MPKAAITGVAGYLPNDVLTNADLEKMVDTSDEWIRSRTGIETRHILKEPGAGTSYMGIRAVESLLEKNKISAESIDLIICATVTPDMPFPATANLIAAGVGATNAFGYDIGAACSGFIYALCTAAQFIQSGSYQKVIVVGADKMSSIVDYEDRTTCVIFGDGAAAVLLEPSATSYGIMNFDLKSDGKGAEFLHMKAGGSRKPASIETVQAREHFVFQDGKPVFKAAIQGMTSTIQSVLDMAGLQKSDLDWLIPHQANLRIIHGVANALDFPHEKLVVNIHKYGNTTAATLPLCMADFEDRFKPGDNIMLTAFGGGFTWGSCLLQWAYEA